MIRASPVVESAAVELALTPAERDFAREVEQFLQTRLPPDIAADVRRDRPVARRDQLRWHAALRERGWLASNWPEAHGGTGWSIMQRHLFDMLCRKYHAPPAMGFNFHMIGPALIAFGTESQQRRFLPKILSDEHWWCQGYSEVEAGSDLAGVSTRAVRVGDDYVVDGTKIWTSGAHEANHIFCLVRTDPDVRKQRGISFLLIDLESPGIDIRPIIAMNGSRLWNMVVFDGVRVPVENRLGAENQGWTVAKKLLGDERLLVSRVSENTRRLTLLADLAAGTMADGEPIDTMPSIRQRMDELRVRLHALEMLGLRLLTAASGGASVGAEPSMTKLLGSQLVQDIDTVIAEVLGQYALPDHADFLFRGGKDLAVGPPEAVGMTAARLRHRGFTLAGGTTEVQKGVIAKAILGL